MAVCRPAFLTFAFVPAAGVGVVHAEEVRAAKVRAGEVYAGEALNGVGVDSAIGFYHLVRTVAGSHRHPGQDRLARRRAGRQ